MRPRASLTLLSLLFASSCAGATELSSDEQTDPPVAAEAVVAEDEPATPVAVAPNPAPNNKRKRKRNRPRSTPSEKAESAPFDSRFTEDVRRAVEQYQQWERVDDEARWAPYLCRMPQAAAAHVSLSDDPKTHGHKLYTLYALDPVAYGAHKSDGPGHTLDGWSQVIVKESFSPVPYDKDSKVAHGLGGGVGPHRLRPAVKDGKSFMAGDEQGLFVMMKASQPTRGTDAGWVYATVDTDGVLSAVGMIDSCMGCHAEAGKGRLFGLPKPPAGNRNQVNGPPL